MVVRLAIFGMLLVFAVPAVAYAGAVPTPSPSPSARETLGQAWWTGPMLAPSAGTLPHGHVLVEPYLYDVMESHANDFGSLTYVIYGLTDRLSVGAIPTAGHNIPSNGPRSSSVGLGDLGVLAQYRLLQYQPGSWVPTTSVTVQETFPTGAYDQLGTHPSDGFGSGVYTTKVSLYMQDFAWMSNGRILRLRLNLSQSFSGHANVDGVSVYGTSDGFRGSVKPGNALSIDASAEYSMTSNWVLASDVVYGDSDNTRLTGNTGVTDLGASTSWAFAPALEYNWTPNLGILVGVRLIPTGHNTAASITPAIAVNYVH